MKQKRQCTYKATLRQLRESIVAVGKQKNIIYFCVYAYARGCLHVCVFAHMHA